MEASLQLSRPLMTVGPCCPVVFVTGLARRRTSALGLHDFAYSKAFGVGFVCRVPKTWHVESVVGVRTLAFEAYSERPGAMCSRLEVCFRAHEQLRLTCRQYCKLSVFFEAVQ